MDHDFDDLLEGLEDEDYELDRFWEYREKRFQLVVAMVSCDPPPAGMDPDYSKLWNHADNILAAEPPIPETAIPSY